MSRETFSNLLTYFVAAFVGATVATCVQREREPQGGGNTDVQVDSVKTQVDTSAAVAPEPAETRPKDTVYVKVYLPSPSVPAPADSVPEPADSVLYLPVLLEQKVYEDSTYRALVSGPSFEEYGPRLDSIQVYSRTTIQYQTKTVYVEPSRWSIGIQAGYGASKDGLTPYLGVGVQYRLWAPKRRKAPP